MTDPQRPGGDSTARHHASTSRASDSRSGEGSADDGLKETLISILIAFALAFVARSFVIEPFVIPTGSMAPTLMGAHMRFHSPHSGFDWAVNPRDYVDRSRQHPRPVQGSRRPVMIAGHVRRPEPITVTDPMTGLEMVQREVPTRAGDRILVLKYLYAIREPRRYDVVVFKNPESPSENFIKRLVGLPGEELWIADGDVFSRRPDAEDPTERDWRIRRKPRRVQEEVWWPLFSSEYAPISAEARSGWDGPWTGEGWTLQGLAYRHDSADRAALHWDEDDWPIDDWTPYNQAWESITGTRIARFPVSDLRMRAGIEPDEPGLAATATIAARGHEFQATIQDGRATLRMRRAEANGETEEWTELASSSAPTFEPGVVANVQFAHVDQRLEVRVDGRRVARAEYDWTPAQRLEFAMRDSDGEPNYADPSMYRRASVRWTIEGSPATLRRVGLDRDLHYRTIQRRGRYARATAPGRTIELGPDQFFVLGDNSAQSRDSRLWDHVDPWAAALYDDTVGVVPRELLMGKAFFVYFPSFHPSPHLPLTDQPFIPDFGRLRFIK